MDENKQIEEIAKDLCPLYEKYKSCKTCDAVLGVGEEPCVYKCMAELITTKGYRKQEWISVEDALPEVGEDVLLYSKEDDKIDIGHYSNMFCRFFLRKFEDGNVPHWMPLPQPPKGE